MLNFIKALATLIYKGTIFLAGFLFIGLCLIEFLAVLQWMGKI